jgi:hypothetical protein
LGFGSVHHIHEAYAGEQVEFGGREANLAPHLDGAV